LIGKLNRKLWREEGKIQSNANHKSNRPRTHLLLSLNAPVD
jgi:hypothetical protein